LKKNENLLIPSYNPTSLHPKQTEIKEKENFHALHNHKGKKKKATNFFLSTHQHLMKPIRKTNKTY